MKLLDTIRCEADSASAAHKRNIKKPNEDRFLADVDRGIFIILDGVTRVHAEYDSSPYESAAGDVGDIFLSEVYEYIKSQPYSLDPEEVLFGAVKRANRLIKEYRGRKSEEEWGFYPSTLGIISILRGSTLHYLCVGDSLGVLLRRRSKILFGREFALEALDLKQISKKERYDLYCNHPENRLSYTVFNGDEVVMEGVEYSYIDIHEGDTLFLASDGIGNYLRYEKIPDLLKQSPEEIISLSERYDRPPYAEYADDKTLIKLSF